MHEIECFMVHGEPIVSMSTDHGAQDVEKRERIQDPTCTALTAYTQPVPTSGTALTIFVEWLAYVV